MKRWLIIAVVILGFALTAMLFIWRSQARSASQPDVVPANLGFALAVMEAELTGVDKEELRKELKQPPFAARWIRIRDSFWYATDQQKAAIERDPDGYFHEAGLVGTENDGAYYILVHTSSNKSMWTQDKLWSVEAAFMTLGDLDRPAIALRLDNKGGAFLTVLTTPHVGEALAIVVDNHVLSAPVITAPIAHNVIIQGDFTYTEAEQLISALDGGP